MHLVAFRRVERGGVFAATGGSGRRGKPAQEGGSNTWGPNKTGLSEGGAYWKVRAERDKRKVQTVVEIGNPITSMLEETTAGRTLTATSSAKALDQPAWHTGGTHDARRGITHKE